MRKIETVSSLNSFNPWPIIIGLLLLAMVAWFVTIAPSLEIPGCDWPGCPEPGTVLLRHPTSGMKYAYCEPHAQVKEKLGYVRID